MFKIVIALLSLLPFIVAVVLIILQRLRARDQEKRDIAAISAAVAKSRAGKLATKYVPAQDDNTDIGKVGTDLLVAAKDEHGRRWDNKISLRRATYARLATTFAQRYFAVEGEEVSATDSPISVMYITRLLLGPWAIPPIELLNIQVVTSKSDGAEDEKVLITPEIINQAATANEMNDGFPKFIDRDVHSHLMGRAIEMPQETTGSPQPHTDYSGVEVHPDLLSAGQNLEETTPSPTIVGINRRRLTEQGRAVNGVD